MEGRHLIILMIEGSLNVDGVGVLGTPIGFKILNITSSIFGRVRVITSAHILHIRLVVPTTCTRSSVKNSGPMYLHATSQTSDSHPRELITAMVSIRLASIHVVLWTDL